MFQDVPEFSGMCRHVPEYFCCFAIFIHVVSRQLSRNELIVKIDLKLSK